MFDNLRDSSFYEDEQTDLYKEPEAQIQPTVARPARDRRYARFLGMTAPQRFVLAFMLLVTICVMGLLAMFLTGSMGLF